MWKNWVPGYSGKVRYVQTSSFSLQRTLSHHKTILIQQPVPQCLTVIPGATTEAEVAVEAAAATAEGTAAAGDIPRGITEVGITGPRAEAARIRPPTTVAGPRDTRAGADRPIPRLGPHRLAEIEWETWARV